MKVDVSQEKSGNAWTRPYCRGALEGAVASASVALPGFYYLHRRSAWYRSLPLPLRVAGVVNGPSPRSRPSRLNDAASNSNDADGACSVLVGFRKTRTRSRSGEEAARFGALSTDGQGPRLGFSTSVFHHSRELALSMAAAGAIVAKDKPWGKLRMWAQGLTIGVLIVAGALTHKNRQELPQMACGDPLPIIHGRLFSRSNSGSKKLER
ncbi:hypothetical protein HD554DRAFT_2176030 [Boletus coccyginus]|nr:hypothetical protein HD554DRAFT_2176030 [Boletus coccyginus]